MSNLPFIPFDPPPDLAAAVIAAFSDSSRSFDQLAASAHTCAEALALWLQRPDIRDRIESTHRVTAWRTRLIASTHLPAVIPTLAHILQDFIAGKPAAPDSPAPPAAADHTDDNPAHALRRELLAIRRAETARRAAALLVTLTRTRPSPGPKALAPAARPTPAPPTPAPDPTPRQHSPEDLEALLAHLAPELERLAQQLDPSPAPPEEAPAPSTDSTRPANSGRSTHSTAPTLKSQTSDLESDISALTSRRPVLTGPNEHWP